MDHFGCFVAMMILSLCLHSTFSRGTKLDNVRIRRERHLSDFHHHHNDNHHDNNHHDNHTEPPLNHTNTTYSSLGDAIGGIIHQSVDNVEYLIEKYGNSTHFSFEGLEHFMFNLYNSSVQFDHHLDDHKNKEGGFDSFHKDHDHDKPLDDHHGHTHIRGHTNLDDMEEDKKLNDYVGKISQTVGNTSCLSASQLYNALKLNVNQTINKTQFVTLCPIILSQLEKKACKPLPLQARKGVPNSYVSAWIGALVSVSLISIAGLIVISIVPILSKSTFFDHVVQFLISLAVGTLTSDALLHLLPHAIVPHSHGSDGQSDSRTSLNHKYVHELSNNALWVGLVAFSAIIFFFVIERVLKLVCRKNHDHVKEQIEINDMNDEGQATFKNGISTKVPLHNHGHHVPSGILSSAWMVAMGDGVHNFADGLAIGASFANSLSVGLSTSVAVLCHELPHELGDFASLLTAGMSVKQAIVCNLVSSSLCLAGVCLGVSIGNHVQSLTTWVFAATAGIFLYVALVDMLPQMTKAYEDDSKAGNDAKNNSSEGSVTERVMRVVNSETSKKLLLQLAGIGIGLVIMLLIGLYEERIVIDVV